MNIVEMLMKLLSGSVVEQLAGLLGQDKEKTLSSVKAALPALLAALGGISSTKEGAQKLASAINDADDTILGNLAHALDTKGSALADQGTSLLGSLLSGGTLSNLASVLGRFTGFGPGVATSLLGTLAPIVLSFLKRETKTGGYDASSLTRLLSGQKDNIARAMPSGLGSMLAAVPGLAPFTTLAKVAEDTWESAKGARTPARAVAADTVGPPKWLVPVLVPLAIALGLAALAWEFWPRKRDVVAVNRESPKDTPRATTVPAAKVAEEVADRITNVNSEVKRVFTDATSAFTKVTDVESAEVADKEIPELTDRLVHLKGLVTKIPEAQRSSILEMIDKSRAALLKAIDKVKEQEDPAVFAVLSPHIEKLEEALDALPPELTTERLQAGPRQGSSTTRR